MVGVYRITNLINNLSYIGQSTDIEKRYERHKYNSTRKYFNSHFYKDIRKYGIENFKLDILEECLEDQLKIRERYWIEKLNTMYPNGYNRSNGAEGISGWKICSEGRHKISISRKKAGIWSGSNNPMYGKSKEISGENNPFYGHKHTEETRRINREKHLGIKLSEETKKKLSKSNIGRKAVNNGNVCIKVYPEEIDNYLKDGWTLGYLRGR